MEFFRKDRSSDHRKIEWRIKRIEKIAKNIHARKKQIISFFASGRFTQEEYVNENLTLDKKLHKLQLKRIKVIASIPLLHKKEVVDLNVRQFCDSAKAQFEKCANFESKRQFLLEHIEKVTYLKYGVTIHGSAPIKLRAYEDPDQTSEVSKIPFQIENMLDKSLLKRGPRIRQEIDGRLKAWGCGGREKLSAAAIKILKSKNTS